ncbi:hypothetical protein GCM10027073_23780 [Streptomyces chlorus]
MDGEVGVAVVRCHAFGEVGEELVAVPGSEGAVGDETVAQLRHGRLADPVGPVGEVRGFAGVVLERAVDEVGHAVAVALAGCYRGERPLGEPGGEPVGRVLRTLPKVLDGHLYVTITRCGALSPPPDPSGSRLSSPHACDDLPHLPRPVKGTLNS